MLLKNFDVDEFWCQAGLAGFSVMTLTYLVGAEHKRLVNTNRKHLREFRTQNLQKRYIEMKSIQSSLMEHFMTGSFKTEVGHF